ncbi:MAG: hypothetical protein DCC88_07095 [Spirobacillus cienkowskii]|uniref:Uncharacterized protein n=1 Tax=Spirobacillus cienkowskii TaxID=495820 RepID=A0A369KN45_9BACT|nr:MAG: hypothetical protein DCC88_07095 [Spirobacillus cienkowskii]
MFCHRKKIIVNLQLFFCLFFVGCNDGNNEYYVINKVRVVAGVFQDSTLISGGNTLTNTSTQQFPLRTGCATTHFYLLVVSPTAETPTVTLNSIKGFPIGNNYLSGGGGARGVSPGQGSAVTLANFLSPASTPSVTIQSAPFRLTVFDYVVNCAHLSTTNLNSYLNLAKDVPGFQLNYTASSAVSSDNGFYSFYFLPDSSDGWWATAPLTTWVSASKIAQIKSGLAITNNPIQISSVAPASSATIPANEETNITANLTFPTVPSGRDPNNTLFNYKVRLQWYVSSGELKLDTANNTNWNPKSSAGSSVGGFVVVRDLLGGIDFKLLGPFTTQ